MREELRSTDDRHQDIKLSKKEASAGIVNMIIGTAANSNTDEKGVTLNVNEKAMAKKSI